MIGSALGKSKISETSPPRAFARARRLGAMGGCLSCAFAQEDEYVSKGKLGARELDEMDVLTQRSLRRA